jgi:hypothetical protein
LDQSLGRQREPSCQLLHLLTHSRDRALVLAVGERFGDQVSDLEHLFFFHFARRDGGRAETDPARLKNRIGVERNGVLVHGDAGAVERLLRLFPIDFFWAKIDQHEMIIGAAGNDAVAMFCDAGGERFGI